MNEYKVDVVVIGAGASGLATALHALELGVKSVALLEKRPYTGGNAAMAGGSLYGANTSLQREAGEIVTCEAALEDVLHHHRYSKVDVPLVRNLIQGSAFMLDWVQSLGGDYRVQAGQTAHAPKKPSQDFGHFRAITQEMTRRFINLGGMLLLQAETEEITREEGGDYRLSSYVKGEKQCILSRCVCLCTGGFLGSQEHMVKYFPDLDTRHYASEAILHTGDGIKLAESLGAFCSNHCCINMHGMNSFDRCYRYPNRIGQESPLWVNRLGRRFVAEESSKTNKNDLGNTVFNQPSQVCYAMFDQKRISSVIAGDFTTNQLKKVNLKELTQVLADEHKRKKWVCISEDLTEIARWIGADPDVLRNTVETYNQACSSGVDDQFAKEAKFLIPLLEAPFVAVKCVPVMIDTYGPVVINEHFEVLDHEFKSIPGLYASGVLTAGWQGMDYYPRGSSLGFSITGGLLCAKEIQRRLQ